MRLYAAHVQVNEGDPMRRLDFRKFLLSADMGVYFILREILWTDDRKFDETQLTTVNIFV